MTAADVEFDGTDLSTPTDRQWRRVRGARIVMVFQEPLTALSPFHRVHTGASRREARKRALEVLRQVHIPDAAVRAAATGAAAVAHPLTYINIDVASGRCIPFCPSCSCWRPRRWRRR